MNKFAAILFSVFTVIAAGSAYAQQPAAATLSSGPPVGQPSTSLGIEHPGERPRALFTIGGFEMHVWTPVSPPYNSQAYTNLPGRSIGEPG